MRGAPYVGFSLAIRRIKARISAFVKGRPTRRRRDRQVQYFRNPSRCHRTTVPGWMMTSASFHRGHTRRSATQKIRSAARILGRGFFAMRMASCWRSARFSIRRSDRDAARRRSQARMAEIRGNIARGWRRPATRSTATRPWIHDTIRQVQTVHAPRGWGFGEAQVRHGGLLAAQVPSVGEEVNGTPLSNSWALVASVPVRRGRRMGFDGPGRR
jgi:hypothetical protein